MTSKRVIAGAAVAAALTIGGFVAGGINQSTTSAQVPTATIVVHSARQNQAQPAQTVEPTEMADPTEVGQAPEPAEVAGTPEPAEVAGNDTDNIQEGDQNGPDTGGADEGQATQETTASEASDAQALASQAQITQHQAEQAALAANPGTTAVHSSLGDEDGTVVYDIELSNGSDVKVNARTGAIVATDSANDSGAENGSTESNDGQ